MSVFAATFSCPISVPKITAGIRRLLQASLCSRSVFATSPCRLTGDLLGCSVGSVSRLPSLELPANFRWVVLSQLYVTLARTARHSVLAGFRVTDGNVYETRRVRTVDESSSFHRLHRDVYVRGSAGRYFNVNICKLKRRTVYYYYHLLQLSFHSVAAVLTPVQAEQIRIYIYETIQKHSTNNTKHSKYKYTYYKNTIQTKQNTVNASTCITKTPTHNKTNIYTDPHITKSTLTQTHTLQNKLK